MMQNRSEGKDIMDENNDTNPVITENNDDSENKNTPSGQNDVGADQEIQKVRKNVFRSNCWYFTNRGYCRYGLNCRYTHPKSGQNFKSVNESVSNNRMTHSKPFENKYSRDKQVVSKSERNSPILTNESILQSPKNDRKQTNNVYPSLHAELNLGSKFRPYDSRDQNLKASKPQSNLGHKESLQKCLVYYNSGRRPEKVNNSKICYYFERGFCRRGDKCKFSHPIGFQDRNNANFYANADPSSDSAHSRSQSTSPGKRFVKPSAKRNIPFTKQCLELKDLSDSQLSDLRETEIQQLKKKFPGYAAVSGAEDVFQFTFAPSDPEWAFDVKSVVMEVAFSKQYPREVCLIEVVNKHGDLPILLVKFLNKAIAEWLAEKHQASESKGKVELIFRPFLRWFDSNLEELFIIGLRKVKQFIEATGARLECNPLEEHPSTAHSYGINSVDHEGLRDASKNENVISDQGVKSSSCEADGKSESSAVFENSEKENVAPDTSEKDGNDDKPPTNVPQNNPNTSKFGTEVKLLDLELTENAAALTCQKIAVTLQCNRCKTRHEISSPPRRCNILKCSKCHQEMQVTFQAALLHQFSALMGNLHLTGCQVVDIPLMNCVFQIDCLNCNKQNSISGIHYGQQRVTWCLFCHKKSSVSTSSAKFHHLQPAPVSGLSTYHHVSENRDRKIKDPAIQEGKPLPDCGACRHYKKSYRWFRFPCCGKTYPCDICHDEKETDHEMKYANRMICGFCAQEQPYSADKPCISCSSSMTKKSGPHWEGGRGCRDKIKMSRDDRQKYAGSNKTVSRRSQSLKTGKGK